MRGSPKPVAIAMAVAAAVTVAACSSGGSSTPASTAAPAKNTAHVTLTWWNNGNTQPLLGVWQQVVSAYNASHPGVTIAMNAIQNEQFKTKIPLALKSTNPPDIFQQWGGGQEATQLQSGKLSNLGQFDSSWISELGSAAQNWQVNGQQYGVPYDLHAVGFWYRKDLFAKAGITGVPTTLAQLESDNAKLKAHGITPISVGSKDGWPDAFWWDYFALRECPAPDIAQAMKSVNLSASCFAKANTDLTAFMATSPFQSGFQATPAQTGAGSSAGLLANGKAAMELQGDWETTVLPPLTSDKQIESQLGWFPFPSVPGGGGDQNAVLGGGDGFSCTNGAAEPACADFLAYLDSTPVQEKLVTQAFVGLPANSAAESSLTSPALKEVAHVRDTQPVDIYFDIALPTNPGQSLDNAVASFFAKPGSTAGQAIINSVSASSGH